MVCIGGIFIVNMFIQVTECFIIAQQQNKSNELASTAL